MTNTVTKLGRVRVFGVRVLVLLPAFAYLAWQGDVAPDYIPLVGWVDDAIVFGLLILLGKR